MPCPSRLESGSDSAHVSAPDLHDLEKIVRVIERIAGHRLVSKPAARGSARAAVHDALSSSGRLGNQGLRGGIFPPLITSQSRHNICTRDRFKSDAQRGVRERLQPAAW